ncbi:MAG: LPS export ABC transporter ATP-binding protein [Candidatus Hydrogenedentota bacterium]
MSQLKAEKISKRFGNIIAVNNISLEFSCSEVIGLLGPNGAGKTTTFYILIGLIKSDTGDVYIDEQKITDFPIHKRAQLGIAYLPQEPSIFRNLTVRNNLLAILEYLPLIEEEREKRINEILLDFNLGKIVDSMGYSLSGGERRRVEIARTLLRKPRFLLLDEPFSGIDPIKVDELKKEIIRLKEKNIGIVITDHNVRELLEITDRAYIINNGEVLIEGNSKDIIESEEARNIYLGENFKL